MTYKIIMEHAIGTIVRLPDGRKAEVVEVNSMRCEGCAYANKLCIELRNDEDLGQCYKGDRTDHKNIIYKEVK